MIHTVETGNVLSMLHDIKDSVVLTRRLDEVISISEAVANDIRDVVKQSSSSLAIIFLEPDGILVIDLPIR